MCIGMDFFGLSFLSFAQLLQFEGFCLTLNLGGFIYYFFEYSLRFTPIVPFSGTLILEMLNYLLLSCRSLSLWLLFYFKIYILFIVQTRWILLICPQVHWFWPVISTLPLSPFTEGSFSIAVIVFFISIISLGSFHSFYFFANILFFLLFHENLYLIFVVFLYWFL